MNKKILAVSVSAVLVLFAGTVALSAQAQTSSESKVYKTIIGLTEDAKGLIKNIIPTVNTINEDLKCKKKFYQFEPFPVEDQFVFVLFQNCDLNDPSACAFNVESIQLNGDGANVVGIIVDEAETDLSNAPISTPTNLLVDTSFGRIGASEFIAVITDDFYTGTVEWNGEKPQGTDLVHFEIPGPGIGSAGKCVPGADREALLDCIHDKIDELRSR